MKLAIMQPYFFPYIGYWQLLNTVDRFVIYDDVNFIKGGWINRNRILINGKPNYVSVPISKASPNKRICDLSLQSPSAWRKKMMTTIENTYRKAPHFSEVVPIVEKIIYHETDSLADFLAEHLITFSKFLGITTQFIVTSRYYQNSNFTGQTRILDICKRENATTYINPAGGQQLYDADTFNSAGVALCFVTMRPLPYKQRSPGFIPNLSMIDAMMEIGPRGIEQHLDNFELTTGKSPDVQ